MGMKISARSISSLGIIGALTLIMVMESGAVSDRKNLLVNGGFEQGLSDDDEPVGWHTRLTGVIAIPQYADPVNKKGRTGVVQFRCGCGYDWGTVRPWAMLVCPQCKHMNPGLEDSGDRYLQNHKHIGIVRRGYRKAIGMKLSEAVGNVQGVRAISSLVTAKRGEGYEIRADAISGGSHLRIFVEGFRKVSLDDQTLQWLQSLPVEANPYGQTYRLQRVFRKQINIETPGAWQTFSQHFVPRKRYLFDVMFVTLYAYRPGEAAFDNVVIRQLGPAERHAHQKQRKSFRRNASPNRGR